AAGAYYSQSLASFEAVRDKRGIAIALNDLGEVALAHGDFEAAGRLEAESITIAAAVGDVERVAFALSTLAAIEAARGRSERAIRLAAAAETRREESGVKFSAAWRSILKSWLEPAYEAVGEQARAVAWNAGRKLSMEQAVAFALEAADYPATVE